MQLLFQLIKPHLVAGLVVLFASIPTLSVAAQDDVTKEAETLIRKGDFNAAYLLLEPLEAERAGDVDYDYLFGVAGVESGNATRGAFALERVLATDPNHKDARAEMAKAHFILGETDASKAEFNNVLQQNPDAETKKTIEKLLTAIQKIEGTTTTFGAYLGFGLGYDSNVSSAPSISSIGVPAFGGLLIQLDNSAREQSDNFMNLSGGFSVRHPFTDKLAVFGAVSGTSRINSDQTAFDNSALDFNAGLQYRQNQHNFSFALQDNHFDLDSEKFRHAYGATAQWLYNVDANNQVGSYLQYSRLIYHGNEIRNADRTIIGLNAAHVFAGDLSPVVFASLYGGREIARDSQFDFLSQDILGVRAGGQLSLNNKWQLFGSLAHELRDNDEDDPTFFKKRKDRQYDASLGLNFVPARDWSIKPQITYTKTDSNIELNSFDRHIISVDIRKDFSW
jgi:outer membrane protein